ncbi:glycosyl transferase [Paractinoplanes deccanensis]|uniref:Glycosyl transferase n=1 Tax=Paractinoplanes deccanensis TaxID=113561 RepID=A0ABQ3YID1_9ACTN|nr:glycosyltransferase [Actinoplanes deccanensis]GID79766.1 glycosyl transferase [Actinoplanes deccanensis]
MRVLFSSVPSQGHFYPLLPLARAFARRGDQVAVLSGAALAADIAAEGFEFLRAGASAEELFAEAARRTGADAGAGASPAAVAEFFAGARLDLGGDAALDAARAWQPDLIVNEMFDLVGVFAAAGLDVPLATVSTGPGVPPEFLGAIAANAAPRFETRGFPVPTALPAGRWLLETCPPDLGASQAPTSAQRWTLRPEAHRGPAGDTTSPPVPAPRRPRVLVTLGSHFAAPDVVGRLLDDLTGGDDPLDVEFLATTLPGTDATAVPHKSEHVTLLPFQPLSRLLTGAAAALIHGGAGTTLGSLAEGVPLVVWPQGADQPVQAAAVGHAGAGIGLASGPVDPQALRDAVRSVLTDPAYAGAARRVQQQIAAMTAPDQVAADLAEALTEH